MRRVTAYALAAAVASATLLPAVAQDEDGGGFLERKLEELLSGEGRDVRITGFRGALSSEAQLDTMTFSDADGIWLELKDVQIDWTRSALLLGRVEVNKLTAGEIDFPRPPLPANNPPSAEATGFSLPDLPVSINIGEVSADRVVLGKPLIGVDAALKVDGSLSLSGGEGAGKITADRLDGAEGSFVVESSYSNESQVLKVNAAVKEAPGGIVATLMGLPNDPALDLSIQGEGPVTDFTANLVLATDGTERVKGTLAVLAQGDGNADAGFKADLSGDVAPLLFPEYQAFFGDNLALLVAGQKRGDGSLGLETLTLDAAQLHLDGTAEIGADGLPKLIDLTGRIASADGTPVLLPQSGPPIRIDGADLRMAFDAAKSEDWTGKVEIDGLDRPGLKAKSVSLDGTGRIEPGGTQHVTADFDFIARALDLGNPEAGKALGEDVSGRIAVDWTQGKPVEFPTLKVTGETYGLDGRATVAASDAGVDINADATVSARDLSAFSGLAGRPLAGSIEADITADTNPVAGLYDITLDATGTGLGTGIAEADQLLAGTAKIDAKVRRDETGSHIDLLTAETDAARIEATADLSNTRGSANVKARLIRTDVIAPDVKGPLDISLKAEGPPDLWDVVLSATGPGTDVESTAKLDLRGDVPQVSGDLKAALADIAPYGPRIGREVSGALDLTASGSLATDLSAFDLDAALGATNLVSGLPETDPYLKGNATLAAAARRTGDTIAISRFRFASPEARAEADGTLDLSGAAPGFTGTLAAGLSDIAPLAPLAGRPLSGAVEVTADGTIVTDLSAFDVKATVASTDLGIGQPQADQVLEGRATADLSATRAGDRMELSDFRFTSPQLTATASGTAQTGDGIADILDGKGTANVRLLSADGILPGMPVPLTANLDASGTREAADVTLTLYGDTITAKSDARIDLAGAGPAIDGTVTLNAADIAPFSELAGRTLRGGIDLTAKGSFVADLSAFDVTADAETRGLSIGQADADALLAGTGTAHLAARRHNGVIEVDRLDVETPALTVKANGTTGRDKNAAQFDVRLANVARWAPGFSGPATASGTANQEGGGDWQVDVNATAPGGTSATIGGTVAPTFDRFSLDARGGLPLQAANAFIAPRAVAGVADFNLRIDGPPALSSVSGRVRTSDAQLSAPTLGIAITGLGATVDIANSGLNVDAGGQFRNGGRVTVSGPIGLTAPFPGKLDVALLNAVFRDPALYETTVNGTVTVDGALAGGAVIGGALTLDKTEIRIPSGASAGGAPDFTIHHVNEPPLVRLTRERAGLVVTPGEGSGGGAGPDYPIDLIIRAPNQVFLRGRGLEAELGGTLTLGGTTRNVVPTGQFELVRGRLDILGQRFGFDEGIATLQGDFNPYIRLVADTQQNDTLIKVIVQGLAASPEILFQSQPDLPQDEVLARLLFGRSVTSLSPLQAAQLAGAVAQLAGKGGDGIVGKLRQDFGLDDLDVAGDGEGGAKVRAGKYISDKIYSDVTVDSAGEAEVSINLDLSKSVKVRGKVGSDGNTGLGVFWERDY